MLLEAKSEVLIMESALFVEKNLSILTMTHRGVGDIAAHLQHIIISLGFHTDLLIKILISKTIEKTSFYTNRGDADENHLVITFTDGTYSYGACN